MRKTLEQTIEAIHALDLEPIKFKAMRHDDGYGWSKEHAEHVAQNYKRYLILHARYPEMTLAPDRDTDRFWHTHILDTRKYAADCDATFGHFLHHFPYLGLRGESDARAAEDAFTEMQHLYLLEFGETLSAVRSTAVAKREAAAHADAAWCAVETTRPAKAAWCAVESDTAKGAWCAVESGTKAEAAWCAVETTKPAKAAWCAVESDTPKAAWCAVESGAKVEAAWCAVETSKPVKAAWCAVESNTTKAAWCAVESGKTSEIAQDAQQHELTAQTSA